MIIKQSQNGKFPLVLLHGWGLNSGVWDFVLADLERHFDVHRIDLPGFGINRTKAPEQYELDMLVELIAPLCPRGSIVVGWSLGGLVASKLALHYGEKLASLCLVASSPCFVEQGSWKGIKPDVLQQFTEQLSDDLDKTVERFMAIQAMGSESARKDIKLLKQAVMAHPAAHDRALSGGLSILQQTDLREPMAQLSLPVRGIYGRLDALVAIQSIRQWASSLPDFDYRVVHKASHAPFISHREVFVESFHEMYRDWL